MKLIIVGVTKCGTTSLSKWLKSKGHEVIDFEYLATRNGGTVFYDTCELRPYGLLRKRRPVLIFRNEIDRKISFKKYYEKHPEFLKGQTENYDIDNIIAQWKYANPMIFHLEEMVKRDDFFHLNSSNPELEHDIS